jgi:hypothetical protein
MRISPADEDVLLALIRRWCRITGQPWYPGLAQGAVDNMEDFIDDNDPNEDRMKPGDMIFEYKYWMENPPWQEEPTDLPNEGI